MLKLWEAASGRELGSLRGHTGWVRAVAFSPDGTRIVSASWDKKLKLWDAASGDELRTLRGHTGPVHVVAFSPDGTRIVSASGDKTLKLWETASGQELATLRGHTDSIHAVALSPDGTRIVSASGDKTLKLWDAASERELATILLLGELHCVALHPWKPLAACGDRGGGFYVIELVGVVSGPIIVTAIDAGQGTELRCPACQQHLPIRENQPGSEMTCPTPGCGLRLKLNPFVTRLGRA